MVAPLVIPIVWFGASSKLNRRKRVAITTYGKQIRGISPSSAFHSLASAYHGFHDCKLVSWTFSRSGTKWNVLVLGGCLRWWWAINGSETLWDEIVRILPDLIGRNTTVSNLGCVHSDMGSSYVHSGYGAYCRSKEVGPAELES